METLKNPVFWGIACLVCLWINLWASTRIIEFMNAKGHKASLFKDGFFIKGKIFSYLPQFGDLAKREGRTTYLLPVFWISFALAFIAFFVGIFLLV
jgi:hypothetical protein